MTRGLALIPIALYGLYIFIQWQDVSDHEADTTEEGIAVPAHPNWQEAFAHWPTGTSSASRGTPGSRSTTG